MPIAIILPLNDSAPLRRSGVASNLQQADSSGQFADPAERRYAAPETQYLIVPLQRYEPSFEITRKPSALSFTPLTSLAT
jgi:hypothetical protein